MKCSEIRELIPLMIDDMLDQEQVEMVEKHLLTCDACKQEMESHLFISGLLKELPQVPLPEEFDSDLRKRLHTVKRPGKKVKWIPFSSLAAIFLVGIFSMAMYNDVKTEPALTPQEFGVPVATMMVADPEVADQEASNPEGSNPEERSLKMESPEMMMKIAEPDEEMIQYRELLDEIYKDKPYYITEWVKESSQVYIISIEIETFDATGNVSIEAISYKGQDGILCKIESSL